MFLGPMASPPRDHGNFRWNHRCSALFDKYDGKIAQSLYDFRVTAIPGWVSIKYAKI